MASGPPPLPAASHYLALPQAPYRTVIADPNWAYQNWTESKNGAAVSQYETASVEEIEALGPWVQSVTDPKGTVLLLWTTWPKLLEGQRVMAAWGFDYVTGVPWVKTTAEGNPARGVGFWTQGASEPLLIGRRGKVSAGRTCKVGLLCGAERQFWSRRQRHSQKPNGIHEYAEEFLPGPYLELYARRERAGWDCVGLELGTCMTPSGIVKAAPPLPVGWNK